MKLEYLRTKELQRQLATRLTVVIRRGKQLTSDDSLCRLSRDAILSKIGKGEPLTSEESGILIAKISR